jgi:hypothetical protein
MKPSSLIIFFFIFSFSSKSQIMLNGSFVSGTSSWGCSAEINAENVYGGASVLNAVAEVDAGAGLCQTVIGLGIGNVYTLSYECSRRVGGCPSPSPTNMEVSISGGALAKTDVRINTSFALTTTSYNFTALSTSHTISFSAGSGFGGSTCGMIIDNITVTLASSLPIELLYFNANASSDQKVITNWETASELNNNFYTIERSKDALAWDAVGTIKGGGTSLQNLKYSFTDHSPYSGVSYYRLKQTDYDASFKYSEMQSIEMDQQKGLAVYPNPSADHVLKIKSDESFPYLIKVYNHVGELVVSAPNHSETDLNLSSLGSGIYYLSISKNDKSVYGQHIILE